LLIAETEIETLTWGKGLDDTLRCMTCLQEHTDYGLKRIAVRIQTAGTVGSDNEQSLTPKGGVLDSDKYRYTIWRRT
jgi:hypothetical protein